MLNDEDYCTDCGEPLPDCECCEEIPECWECGVPLPEDETDASFCSVACQTAYYADPSGDDE